MPIFTACEGKFNDICQKYKKSGEMAEVSRPLKYRNEMYREIIYKKKSLFSKGEIAGRIIIDEFGQVVIDDRLISRLAPYFYYMESLFDRNYRKRISRTILSEDALNKEAENYQLMIFPLEVLEREGMEGIKEVTEIIEFLPENKKENNKSIKNYLDKSQEYENSDKIFDCDIIEEVKLLYKETLMQNFRKVKTVNKGRDYYDNIKRAITGSGRRRMRSMGKYVLLGSTRLEDSINSFIRALKLYDPVLDMTENQYFQYISKMDYDKIKELETTIRTQ